MSVARSSGHSIAVPDTSPSPCAPWPSPAMQQGSVDRDREVESRAGDELLAVDVPAPAARRRRRVLAGLRRRHPDHAEERCRAHAALAEVPPVAVERPREVSPSAHVPPHSRGDDLVDRDDERLPGARAAHLDRAVERVACALAAAPARRRRPRTSRRSAPGTDRATGVDRLDRLVLARRTSPSRARLLDPGVRRCEQDAQPDPLPVLAAELPERDRLLVAVQAPARPRPGRSRPAAAARRPRRRPRSGRARSPAPGRARAAARARSRRPAARRRDTTRPASLTTRTRGSSHFIASPVAASRSQ